MSATFKEHWAAEFESKALAGVVALEDRCLLSVATICDAGRMGAAQSFRGRPLPRR